MYSEYSKHLRSQTNFTTTENGEVTLISSLNSCVDFFYSTLKTPEDYYSSFLSALAEDRLTAVKILFWHRDIRSTGMGRRENFRYVLSKSDQWRWPASDFTTNAILHYGRADDLLSLLDSSSGKDALQEISKQLKAKNALVAKWMPRESSKKKNYRFYARRIANYMAWTPKQYRKNISDITTVVEQQMVAKKWEEIDFNKVPSQANMKYKNAFYKNTMRTYSAWQQSLIKKDNSAKVNVATLLPHQIIAKYGFCPSGKDDTLEAMWAALPKVDTNCLVIADTSGSMFGTPLQVSIALALYFAERNPYKGFITFSDEPKWHMVYSEDLYSKINSIRTINCANTNMQKTFELLLRIYEVNKMMPDSIVIISDMQFDSAITDDSSQPFCKFTFFNKMKSEFKSKNAPFPKIIFWNVRQNSQGVPVSFDETGTALISGYNPAVMGSILNCEDLSAEKIMKNAIKNINPTL